MPPEEVRKLVILLTVLGVGYLWFYVLFTGKRVTVALIQAQPETIFNESKQHGFDLKRSVKRLYVHSQTDLQKGKIHFQLLDTQGKELKQWMLRENQTTYFSLIQPLPAGEYDIRANGNIAEGSYEISITIPPRISQVLAGWLLAGVVIGGGCVWIWRKGGRNEWVGE